MAKRGRPRKAQPGEQRDLIEVGPENLSQIRPVAVRYRYAMRERLAALARETKAKEELLGLVRAAKLSRLDDGTIKFRCDGLEIRIKPRDELVQVIAPKGKDGTNGDEGGSDTDDDDDDADDSDGTGSGLPFEADPPPVKTGAADAPSNDAADAIEHLQYKPKGMKQAVVDLYIQRWGIHGDRPRDTDEVGFRHWFSLRLGRYGVETEEDEYPDDSYRAACLLSVSQHIGESLDSLRFAGTANTRLDMEKRREAMKEAVGAWLAAQIRAEMTE